MGSVSCRACKGSGAFYTQSGKRLDCKACGGSGINRNLWSTRCERCRTEIIYKAASTTPRFCKDCRNIQLEKHCSQMGCNNTIRYSVGWDNVPNYCKRCQVKRQQGWSASTCPGTGIFGCGNLIWSPPGKRFTLCPDCSARKKSDDEAKWREKSCPGLKGESYCGKTIRYRTDWDKVPDICPDCRVRAKAQKAERDAKMREKLCAGRDCRNMVNYSIDWEHPPSFCKPCSEKRKALQAAYPNINRKHTTTDTSYVMPGMGQTIGQMGGTRGEHYPRKQPNDIHCMVFEGMRDNDLHYSWNIDPITGDVIGEVYMHTNNPRG